MPRPPEASATGSRNDLRVEASRCLRFRSSESRCERCSAICPHAALSLDDGLSIAAERCHGCLLCTTACPSGALEPAANLQACAAKLAKVPEPVLGCVRTREQANSWLPCLGGLSDEHLVYLSHTVAGRLTLNISHCSDCSNSAILSPLLERLAALRQAGSGTGACCITAADSAEQLRFREEEVDRRGFFKSLRSSLFQSVTAVLSGETAQPEQASDYISKRLPARRALLNSALENANDSAIAHVKKRFYGTVTISGACTACQGCVAICPTGALRSIGEPPEEPPSFESSRCTSCGLCEEFCLDNALTLSL